MHDLADLKPTPSPDIYQDFTYKRHRRGAFLRSIASFIMWLSCFGAYLLGFIHIDNLIADSIAVLYLILMNIPCLWILTKIHSRNAIVYFGIFIHLLEIIGYTAVIYSFGGIEATYLTPIYAALITYVGIVGNRSLPFIVAGLCSICFGLMITLEHIGFLQTIKINPLFHIPWSSQLAVLAVVSTLLFITAFVSSYAARLLKMNRDQLRRQNEELQQIAIRASESDRMKSEFLANMSHELRTPLNIIIGFSELLENQDLGYLNARQGEAVKDINTSGKHLLSIINDLLDLSKVEAGRMDLEVSGIPLKKILADSLSVFRERIQALRIRVAMDINDCPEVIQADERKIRQILYNLLSNAVKFTPQEGSVNLSSRILTRTNHQWLTRDGVIVFLPSINGWQPMNHDRVVEITVADTGIGLKRENLERIFNPFEQADGSMSRRYQGTGLGLSLSRRFAELHQGQIWAESEGENKGSIFHFVIPA